MQNYNDKSGKSSLVYKNYRNLYRQANLMCDYKLKKSVRRTNLWGQKNGFKKHVLL